MSATRPAGRLRSLDDAAAAAFEVEKAADEVGCAASHRPDWSVA